MPTGETTSGRGKYLVVFSEDSQTKKLQASWKRGVGPDDATLNLERMDYKTE